MRGALCVATHLYILYLAADESISGWEFFLLIPKSPHHQRLKYSYNNVKFAVYDTFTNGIQAQQHR